MSNTKIEFKDTINAFQTLNAAWEAQDFGLSRDALTYLCDTVSIVALEAGLLINIDNAMEIYRIFVKTGLDYAEDGTPARAFFLKVNRYVIDNATPEIKQAMDEAFHEFYGKDLKPTGYDDNGDPCYAMKDVCEVVGCTEEQAIDDLGGTREILSPEQVHRIQ